MDENYSKYKVKDHCSTASGYYAICSDLTADGREVWIDDKGYENGDIVEIWNENEDNEIVKVTLKNPNNHEPR